MTRNLNTLEGQRFIGGADRRDEARTVKLLDRCGAMS
jgi:hypothetical protein